MHVTGYLIPTITHIVHMTFDHSHKNMFYIYNKDKHIYLNVEMSLQFNGGTKTRFVTGKNNQLDITL